MALGPALWRGPNSTGRVVLHPLKKISKSAPLAKQEGQEGRFCCIFSGRRSMSTKDEIIRTIIKSQE